MFIAHVTIFLVLSLREGQTVHPLETLEPYPL